MFKFRWNLILIVFALLVFMVSGCHISKKICLPDQSIECKKALINWQTTIDYIVKSNFPPDYGMYKAIIWDEEFDNAWVVKGRQINITKRFLGKLNPAQRICVAAHELAHLKMGHYYSRIGIIITDSKTAIPENYRQTTQPQSHYGSSISIDTPDGFGINQEIEADRMALKLIKNSGLNVNHYLDLLKFLQGHKKDPDSLIYHRILQMEKLR